MSTIRKVTDSSNGFTWDDAAFVSGPVNGKDITVGTGFKAQSFRAVNIGEAMDPLVMVDHFVMTEPTFGVHPHAGMSAVSLLFEDSEGIFHNRDSLGKHLDLRPGDLYWLSTGSGAVHDEYPLANSRIHALQVFVNVPQSQRFEEPTSRLVRSEDMPVIHAEEYRVKVVLGESNNVCGAASPSIPMTMLDGTIQAGGRFSHRSVANRGIWVQAIKGSLEVVVGETTRHLASDQAIAIKTNDSAKVTISNPSRESVHFVLFDGAQIAETFVQDGPFVMGSQQEIADIKAAYEAGELGSIADNR